jgi:hypothetical protein
MLIIKTIVDTRKIPPIVPPIRRCEKKEQPSPQQLSYVRTTLTILGGAGTVRRA